MGERDDESKGEITGHLFNDPNSDLGTLVPNRSAFSSDEYVQSFTDSQRRAFEWVSTAHQNDQQIFAAVVSPIGTGKSYLLNGLIKLMWLRGPYSHPVVLPPISLHGGTNVHNFFARDIFSRLEHGTTQATLVCRTNVLVIDEFSMITFYLLHTAEGLTQQRASAANLQTLPCLSHTTRSLSPHSCHNAVTNPEHVISQARNICSFPLTSWLTLWIPTGANVPYICQSQPTTNTWLSPTKLSCLRAHYIID